MGEEKRAAKRRAVGGRACCLLGKNLSFFRLIFRSNLNVLLEYSAKNLKESTLNVHMVAINNRVNNNCV